MAELFTHVLVGFIIAVVLSWKLKWITRPMIPVAMVGAAIPDLSRIDLLIPEEAITAVTGIPWTWGVLHRAGGALLVIAIFTLLVRRDLRRPVVALLTIGVCSHFVLDYFLWQPTGETNLLLWPFLDIAVDYQGFYRSSDRWPAIVATFVAGVVLAIDRFVVANTPEDLPRPSSSE